MDNKELTEILNETANILNETEYTIEKGNLLYADGKFIGSFDNDEEKRELIEEYENEQKK